VIYGSVLSYVVGGLLFGYYVNPGIFFGLSFALLFFAFGQALYEIGVKGAVLFVLVSSLIGFGVEVLGTNTGYVFGGKYTYGDFLGDKVLGVPIVVPLVWFVISYITFSLSFPKVGANRKWGFNFVIPIALASFGAMAWDLMVDPMFSTYGYWTWESNSSTTLELSGVPVTNFFGWFVVIFAMLAVFLGVSIYTSSMRKGGNSMKKVIKRRNTLDSRISYLLLMTDAAVANEVLGHYFVVVIGIVAMSLFVVLSYMLKQNATLGDL
jgi:uncharacterized membrane protein